ncbi:MAG: cytochrome oxidase putative small subunit CydP, partial [Lysobacterales bacterium]
LSSPEHPNAPPRPLRRLTLELFGLIALKIVLLMLIWWLVFAPQPKPDVSPAAIADRLAPAHTPPEVHP